MSHVDDAIIIIAATVNDHFRRITGPREVARDIAERLDRAGFHIVGIPKVQYFDDPGSPTPQLVAVERERCIAIVEEKREHYAHGYALDPTAVYALDETLSALRSELSPPTPEMPGMWEPADVAGGWADSELSPPTTPEPVRWPPTCRTCAGSGWVGTAPDLASPNSPSRPCPTCAPSPSPQPEETP